MSDAAVAAIQYALTYCDGDQDTVEFLQYWNEGEFNILRNNWDNIPDAVFIGADTLHPGTKAELDAQVLREFKEGDLTQALEDIVGDTTSPVHQMYTVSEKFIDAGKAVLAKYAPPPAKAPRKGKK